MSLLGKRESMTSLEKNVTPAKTNFFRTHLPDLLEDAGRIKYFVDYEFPMRQTILKKYWERAIKLFYKHAIEGAVAYWEDISEFFNFGISYPCGLTKIVEELVNEGDYIVLKNDHEFSKLASVFGGITSESSSSDGLWQRLRGIFQAKPSILSPTSIIVNVEQFKSLYRKIEQSLSSIFYDKHALTEEEFMDRFKRLAGMNPVDQRAIIALLLHFKEIFKTRIENITVYYSRSLANESSNDIDAALQEIVLEKKLVIFDNKLNEITTEIDRTKREALFFKKQGKKLESMQALQRCRGLSKQYEKLNTQRLLLFDIQGKLKTTHDERQLADILKATNKVLKENQNQFETIADAIDNINEFDAQSAAMNNLINDWQNKDELNELYDDLGEPAQLRIPDNRPLADSVVNALRNSAQKPSRIQEEDPNKDLTESQIFQKRIHELLE
jgi:hypothetical protein